MFIRGKILFLPEECGVGVPPPVLSAGWQPGGMPHVRKSAAKPLFPSSVLSVSSVAKCFFYDLFCGESAHGDVALCVDLYVAAAGHGNRPGDCGVSTDRGISADSGITVLFHDEGVRPGGVGSTVADDEEVVGDDP